MAIVRYRPPRVNPCPSYFTESLTFLAPDSTDFAALLAAFDVALAADFTPLFVAAAASLAAFFVASAASVAVALAASPAALAASAVFAAASLAASPAFSMLRLASELQADNITPSTAIPLIRKRLTLVPPKRKLSEYTLFMRLLALFAALPLSAQLPAGFQSIFNGKDLAGWHISETNHHGNTKSWKVERGILTAHQDPPLIGGILLTDRAYKNFEIYLEINPDFGCDGGLFLRSTEKGEAYQVMIDFLEGGNVGGLYGERLPEMNKPDSGVGQRIDREWRRHWKEGEWNSLRARIEGDAPHIQVWLNGAKVSDWTANRSYLPDTGTAGMIAVQVHRSSDTSSRWKPGGYHRFRNIGVKELP